MTVLRAQSISPTTGVAVPKVAHSQKLRRPCTPQPRRPRATTRDAEQCSHLGQVGTQSKSAEQDENSFRRGSEGELKAVDGEPSTSRPWLVTATLAAAPLLLAGPALAYNKGEAEQVIKNLAGGAYVLLVCFFFFRLFRKRAKTGTTQTLASQVSKLSDEAAEPQADEDKEATPLGALWGAIQAGAICYLLFQLCGLVDGYFARQEMPDQYTAHNITVALRTVIRGLAYLVTFLFGANCVGLTGLSIQMLFFPDSLQQDPTEQEKQS